MTERKSYWEKLKDPRWQKRRLEMLDLAGFECQQCCETTKTLHVHHKIYRKGADPWDYPDEAFLVLCEDCHEAVTIARQALDEALATIDPTEFERLRGFIHASALILDSRKPDALPLHVSIPSTEYAEGLGARLGLTWYESNYHLCRPDLTVAEVGRLYALAQARGDAAIRSGEWFDR